MRKTIIAGNWKMNKNVNESVTLVQETLELLKNENTGETVVIFCPPFLSLEKVSSLVAGMKNVFSSAQNCYWEKSGAYTGEVSAAMIKAVGAGYVIIGHSERRQYFSETNGQLAKKVNAAITEGLMPIYCCGEPLEIREANTHFELVKQQIHEGLFHLSPEDFGKVVIAYEPVWAIGTGRTPTLAQIAEVHDFLRARLLERFGPDGGNFRLLYGGSVKPSNASLGLSFQT